MFTATNTALVRLYFDDIRKHLENNIYDITEATKDKAGESLKNIIGDSVLENGACILADFDTNEDFKNIHDLLDELITLEGEKFTFVLEFRLAKGYPKPHDAMMALFIDQIIEKKKPINIDDYYKN